MSGKLTICRKCGGLDHETEQCNPSRVRCRRCGATGHPTKDCMQYLPQTSEPGLALNILKRPPSESQDSPAAKKPKVAAAAPWRPSRPIAPATVDGSTKPQSASISAVPPRDWANWRQDAPVQQVANRGQARQKAFAPDGNLPSSSSQPPAAPPIISVPKKKPYNPFLPHSDSEDDLPASKHRVPVPGSPLSSPSPSPAPARLPSPVIDEFGRTVATPRSPSPDYLSLTWEERMDRMIDKYDKEKTARDLLRAKYGQLSPSPPRPPRQRSLTPPAKPALPNRVAVAPQRSAKPQPERVKKAGALRNWEADLEEDFFVDKSALHGPAKPGHPLPTTGPGPGPGEEEDEAGAALEARLRALQQEEEEEEEEYCQDALR